MRIGNLLAEQQKSLFVGRKKELALLEQCLSESEWSLLHFYGPGGIGKTSLLRLFAQSIGPTRCLYLDGHHHFQSPQQFLTQVRRAWPTSTDAGDPPDEIDLLNAHATVHGGIILMLDTFEKWGALEHWLRDEWFPKLSPLVKICSAGRYPLEDQWVRDGWHLFVQNIELEPLSFDEIQTYTQTRGIESKQIVASLQRFSNGLPLAVSMACEIIVRKGGTFFLDQKQKDHVIAYLVEELTSDLKESYLKRYTEAASMVWYFDHELLQSLLQEQISIVHFREFCRLPFVIQQADRWTLHDSIRQWAFKDLRNRMPQTFHRYRQHALKALTEREVLLPHKKTELAFERLYLHESDLIRDFQFQWDDRLRFRTCREDDFQFVEQLYLEYLHNQSNFIPDEVHLESLIRPLWQIDPSAFYGLWREQELVAFCSCILLTEETVQLFQSNPITAPITSRFRAGHRQYLLCFTGVATDLEQDISGSLARALVHIIERNKHAEFLNLLSVPYWLNYLPLLGFKRAPWADSTTPLGVRYLGHQLDLRHEDVSAQISRIYATMESTATVEKPAALDEANHAPESKLSLEEATALVQRALKHFPLLPLHPEIIQTLLPILPEVPGDAATDRIASFFQDKVRHILDTFHHGSEEEQRFYRILQHAYIKKMGTHEVVSEHLSIPIKSYYRHLRSAVRLLTYELIKR